MATSSSEQYIDVKSDTAYLDGWTIQQGVAPEAPETIPGNVVLAEELPLASSLEKQGVDPKQYFANLHVVADEEQKAVARGEKAPKVDEEPVEDEAPAEEPVADEKPSKA